MTETTQRIETARQSQPLSELRRKAEKARSRSNIWTQEEIDLAEVEAAEMAAFFGEGVMK
jgi:hypothetical protein